MMTDKYSPTKTAKEMKKKYDNPMMLAIPYEPATPLAASAVLGGEGKDDVIVGTRRKSGWQLPEAQEEGYWSEEEK